MRLPENDFQILKLTDKFYKAYPNVRYKEILKKIVIIEKTEYVDTKDAVVDPDEFHETMCNIDKIKREELAFVEDYIAHMKKERMLHPKEFKRRYDYSSLQYFHRELGIE